MPNASDLFFKLIFISLALVVLLIGGYIVVRWIRRGAGDIGAGGEPFTLQDLREMRASGQITQREFETMKTAMIGRATAPKATEKPAPLEPPPIDD